MIDRETAVEAMAVHRDRVDEVDRAIVELLNERTKAVEEIGRGGMSIVYRVAPQ